MKLNIVTQLILSCLAGVTPTAIAQATGENLFQPRQVAITELKPRADWRNVGRSTPEAAFETLCWASATGELEAILGTILIDDAAREVAERAFATFSAEEQKKFGTSERMVAMLLLRRTPLGATKMLGVIPNPRRADEVGVHWLNRYDDGRIRENRNIVLRLVPDGWRQVVPPAVIEMMAGVKVRNDSRSARPTAGAASTSRAPSLVPIEKLQHRGNDTALAAIETFLRAKARGDFAALQTVVGVTPQIRSKAVAQWERLSPESRAAMPHVKKVEDYAIMLWLGGVAAQRETSVQIETEMSVAPDNVYFTGRRLMEKGGSNFDYVFTRTDEGWKWFIGEMWPAK